MLKHFEPSSTYRYSVFTCDAEGCPCTITAPDFMGLHDCVLSMAKAGRWVFKGDRHYCVDHEYLIEEEQ